MDDVDELPIDWHIFSVRDFLGLVQGVREGPRRGDPLRVLEDHLLDLVDQVP